MTTTTLTSSVNPSQMGQTVTFTATIAPAAATGTVTFSDGSTPLCNAVPVASGVATCNASFATQGAHAITATYSSDTTYGTSSGSLTQSVNDSRAKAVAAIGAFLGSRNNQILTNGPDGQRQIDRLLEAGGAGGGNSGGAGFTAGSPSISRLGEGPDATAVSRLRGFAPSGLRPLSEAIAANAAGANLAGFGRPGLGGNCDAVDAGGRFGQRSSPIFGVGAGEPCSSGGGGGSFAVSGMRFHGMLDGAMRFGFSTSLRDIGRAAANSEARKLAEAGLGLASGGVGVIRSRPNPFDAWVEAKYTSFDDNRANADLSGHFGLISIGADYVLGPNLLVGTMIQFDSMQQRSDSKATDVRGTGWMAGPYATLRLSPNLFWQTRGAWGRSSNEVSPFLTYTDKFDSTRWLASTTLAGHWQHGPWSFRPSASISYMEDTSESYVDTFGIDIPSVKSRLGQAKAGPVVGYRIDLGPTVIEPRAGVQVIYNFANDTTAKGFGVVGDEAAGPDGARGRAEVGVRATTSGGVGLDVSGSYDGIGASNYNAVTGRVMLRVPLN